MRIKMKKSVTAQTVIDFFFRCLLRPIEGLLSYVLGESPDALWSVDFKLIFGASGQVAHFAQDNWLSLLRTGGSL